MNLNVDKFSNSTILRHTFSLLYNLILYKNRKQQRISYDKITVIILSFRTDWSGQIVQTRIKLLLEEQSDQGLHYLQYCLHLLDALLYGKTSLFEF